MEEKQADNHASQDWPDGSSERWARGVDFSGTTVILGVAGGQLAQILNDQIIASQGQLLAIDFQPGNLEQLRPLFAGGAVSAAQARFRSIPLLPECADLVVANGIMREAPTERLGAVTEELWRVLVPGGILRISDIIEPSEVPQDAAWAQRNQIVRTIGKLVHMPTALSVDITSLAKALRESGFEGLTVSFLPGYPLTEAWLEESVNGFRRMASRIVARGARDQVLQVDIPKLIDAFAQGDQRAAKRFVLSGQKPGTLVLEMQASFDEEDLSVVD